MERPLVEIEDREGRVANDLVAELDPLGEDDLLFGSQKWNASDLAQVEPDRVLGLELVRRLDDDFLVLLVEHGRARR